MLVLLALTAAASGCDVFRNDADVAGKTIGYQLEYYTMPGNALSRYALSISFATNDGPEQQKGVLLPWSKDIGAAQPGFTPSLKAQFNGYGTLVCRILADGEVVASAISAEDAYAVVECAM